MDPQNPGKCHCYAIPMAIHLSPGHLEQTEGPAGSENRVSLGIKQLFTVDVNTWSPYMGHQQQKEEMIPLKFSLVSPWVYWCSYRSLGDQKQLSE